MNLNSRQAKALRNIVFESAFLQGDFQVPGKLGVGIGKVTFDSLSPDEFGKRLATLFGEAAAAEVVAAASAPDLALRLASARS